MVRVRRSTPLTETALPAWPVLLIVPCTCQYPKFRQCPKSRQFISFPSGTRVVALDHRCSGLLDRPRRARSDGMRQPDRGPHLHAHLPRNLSKIPPRLIAVPFPLRRPAAFFRWETTAACRTTSFGIRELINEVCAPHPTCAPPISTIPLVLTIPPCAASSLIPHAHATILA